MLFSCSVVSDSLWPHGLQNARLPCPSLSPEVCWNSCPLSQWCHPTVSFSIVPFSSYPQSFPTSGSFPISWLFISGGHSIGASASVLPMNIQGWFRLELTGLISLMSKGPSRVFSSATIWKRQLFGAQPSLGCPGGASGKEPVCQCRRLERGGFDPWVGKIPWRRKWQSTPVFFPREFHGERSRLQPIGSKGSDTTEAT